MAIIKTIEMKFKNALGKNATISIPDVKDGLLESDVQTAMSSIISANIFSTTGGDLVQKISAQIVTKDTDILFEQE